MWNTSPEILQRLFGCCIRFYLTAQDDSKLLVAVVPELYQPVERTTIEVVGVVDDQRSNKLAPHAVLDSAHQVQKLLVSIQLGHVLVKRLFPFAVGES